MYILVKRHNSKVLLFIPNTEALENTSDKNWHIACPANVSSVVTAAHLK